MKHFISLILLAWAIAAPAQAQTRYISDNLFTYMHSGPSNQYKIIGSVNAGDRITQLASNRSTGFTQIVDTKGRKGWVESKFVSRQPGLGERLPKVEEELASVKTQLANARKAANNEKAGLADSLEQRNKQIQDLEQSYSDVNNQLISSQTEVRELRAKLDTQKEDLLLKYFMYGGGVAGIGLLFGLLLPHMIPSRKKKPNGWS
ncbi:predicted signal transduction protein (SH3 domain) [Aliivibrio fischeri ES114]|uniref:Predicted signal transduction protein (SH3 domain) n=1 Tax=Aliivibrio fischeri (strain ATCC 700601 / ES114) TaxID=312309 RepID=Q5E2L0_ALIF1|nr:TIGR04211 family SH3 domain-containing protein [Aliivibrio fischeri]AAW86736.1 predicted signal transduction protein (SH3 domain) [Aliivibrio fischeri ES114]KLU78746.1 arylsulfatase [Aliivibrio fischeri]MUK90959.1 SH3 domain-containing protein [Aliivibrio fischeri]MUL02364.1 SH3 domain-containing protein [Aliivibrio fischeri]MUL18642.1 SH3 domain-containing protein [Aliivibrio fischeri]